MKNLDSHRLLTAAHANRLDRIESGMSAIEACLSLTLRTLRKLDERLDILAHTIDTRTTGKGARR